MREGTCRWKMLEVVMVSLFKFAVSEDVQNLTRFFGAQMQLIQRMRVDIQAAEQDMITKQKNYHEVAQVLEDGGYIKGKRDELREAIIKARNTYAKQKTEQEIGIDKHKHHKEALVYLRGHAQDLLGQDAHLLVDRLQNTLVRYYKGKQEQFSIFTTDVTLFTQRVQSYVGLLLQNSNVSHIADYKRMLLSAIDDAAGSNDDVKAKFLQLFEFIKKVAEDIRNLSDTKSIYCNINDYFAGEEFTRPNGRLTQAWLDSGVELLNTCKSALAKHQHTDFSDSANRAVKLSLQLKEINLDKPAGSTLSEEQIDLVSQASSDLGSLLGESYSTLVKDGYGVLFLTEKPRKHVLDLDALGGNQSQERTVEALAKEHNAYVSFKYDRASDPTALSLNTMVNKAASAITTGATSKFFVEETPLQDALGSYVTLKGLKKTAESTVLIKKIAYETKEARFRQALRECIYDAHEDYQAARKNKKDKLFHTQKGLVKADAMLALALRDDRHLTYPVLCQFMVNFFNNKPNKRKTSFATYLLKRINSERSFLHKQHEEEEDESQQLFAIDEFLDKSRWYDIFSTKNRDLASVNIVSRMEADMVTSKLAAKLVP